MSTATSNNSVNHDYTTEPDDDFSVPDVLAHDLSPDEIKKANEFRDPPEGYNILVLSDYEPPTTELIKVLLNGQLTSFEAKVVALKFTSPDDERVSIRDYFTMPPSDESQRAAYMQGVILDKRTGKPSWGGKGREASKFYAMIGAIGYDYPKGGRLPTEAIRGKNWMGRRVGMIVQGAQPYSERDANGIETGIMKPGRARVKMFSYQRADAPPPAVDSKGLPAQVALTPATAYSAPMAIPADTGTDDI